MAHRINGNRVATVGTSWHGLGTVLKEAQTAEEMIKASGLDYEVKFRSLAHNDDGSVVTKFKSIGATIDGQWRDFAPVTDTYSIIQNRDAFRFFDTVTATGDAKYVTAGSLGDGELIFLSAILPESILVMGVDEIKKYLLLATSHDGSMSCMMFFTPVRTVCWNTLNQAIQGMGKHSIKIRHTGNVFDKVDEARVALGLALDFYSTFEQVADRMAHTSMDKESLRTYTNRVFKVLDEKETATKRLNQRGMVEALFDSGKGNAIPQVRHTLWTAYNAVTEFADHHLTVHGEAENPSNRISSVLFGGASTIKQRAMNEALALIK